MKLVVILENFGVAVMKRCTQVERSGGDIMGHIVLGLTPLQVFIFHLLFYFYTDSQTLTCNLLSRKSSHGCCHFIQYKKHEFMRVLLFKHKRKLRIRLRVT